jgi:hypothetical protein
VLELDGRMARGSSSAAWSALIRSRAAEMVRYIAKGPFRGRQLVRLGCKLLASPLSLRIIASVRLRAIRRCARDWHMLGRTDDL